MIPGTCHIAIRSGARLRGRGFTLVELIVVIGIIILLVAITAAVSTTLVSRSESQRTESTLSILDAAMADYSVTADRIVSYGNDDPGTNQVYDLQMDEPHLESVTRLLGVIGRMPTVRSAIGQIDDQFIWRRNVDAIQPTTDWMRFDVDDPDPNATALTPADFGDGEIVILDAWETPIRIIHPGRLRDALVPVVGPSAQDTDPPLPGDPWPAEWPPWLEDKWEDDGTVVLVDDPPFTGMEEFYGMARNRRICFVSAGPDKKFGNVSAEPDTEDFKQSLDNLYSYEVVRP